MKIRGIAVILLTAVALYACSAAESDGEFERDELLAGTTWEYKMVERTPSAGVPDEMWVSDNILWNILAALQIPYDTTGRTAAGCDTIRNIRHSISATLTFTDSKCQYQSTEQSADSIVHYTKHWKVFQFEPGQYHDPEQRITVSITADRIKVGYSAVSPIAEWELSDGKLEIYNGRKVTDSQLIQTSATKACDFEYRRDENEVILTGESAKWVGLLNRSKWTLEVVQIQPSRGAIHIFELQ